MFYLRLYIFDKNAILCKFNHKKKNQSKNTKKKKIKEKFIFNEIHMELTKFPIFNGNETNICTKCS